MKRLTAVSMVLVLVAMVLLSAGPAIAQPTATPTPTATATPPLYEHIVIEGENAGALVLTISAGEYAIGLLLFVANVFLALILIRINRIGAES
jgi:hypothetical protein